MPYSIDNRTEIAYVTGGFTPPRGQIRYWFGNVDNTLPAAQQLDFAGGFLTPYMETNRSAFQCPDFGPSQVDVVRFGEMASGYAYNGHSLGRGISYDFSMFPAITVTSQFARFRDIAQQTRTIAFADSAQVDFLINMQEIWLLEPPSANYPSIHFRHSGAANVAFLDGHVESRSPHFKIDVPGTNFISPAQAAAIEEHQLGYVSDSNVDDPAVQDELYDQN